VFYIIWSSIYLSNAISRLNPLHRRGKGKGEAFIV
jgi:hypothetical protein